MDVRQVFSRLTSGGSLRISFKSVMSRCIAGRVADVIFVGSELILPAAFDTHALQVYSTLQLSSHCLKTISKFH